MKYSIAYNPARKIWMVWRTTKYDAEVVKTFKTERGAQNWIEKH